jgi:hypothetical protein
MTEEEAKSTKTKRRQEGAVSEKLMDELVQKPRTLARGRAVALDSKGWLKN